MQGRSEKATCMGRNEKVVLVWVLSRPKSRVRLSKNILREVCDYLVTPQFLVRVHDTYLSYFSLDHREWKAWYPLSECLQRYTRGHAIAFLPDSSLFVCGAGATAHRITAGVVTTLPLMLTGRYYHCAICPLTTTSVYVFGGCGHSTPSRYNSERFDFLTQKWESFPKLCRPRAGANACEHQRLIYLCGGDAVGTVETYDWQRNVFTLVEGVTLPLMNEACASVIVDNTCFCIGETVSFQWSLSSKRVSRTVKQERREVRVSCPPVVWEGVVYVEDESGCCGVSMSTGKVVGKYRRAGPSYLGGTFVAALHT